MKIQFLTNLIISLDKYKPILQEYNHWQMLLTIKSLTHPLEEVLAVMTTTGE